MSSPLKPSDPSDATPRKVYTPQQPQQPQSRREAILRLNFITHRHRYRGTNPITTQLVNGKLFSVRYCTCGAVHKVLLPA